MPQEATALALTGGSGSAPTASTACGSALWQLLTGAGSANETTASLRRKPDLLARAVALAPDLDARQATATPEEIVKLLAPLVAVYQLAERSEDEWAAFWTVYLDALESLPAESIREAVVAYTRRGAAFFPKPSEMHKLAEPYAVELRVAAYRAKCALRDAAEPKRRPVVSAEERAEIAAGLRELAQATADRSKARVASTPLAKTPQLAAARLRAAIEEPASEAMN